jgi:NADP-dependent 3-hydroxy acid dehydrogenase YdfG
MNRSLIIVMGALALCGAIFAGSYFTARHATMVCCTRSADDLSWLQTEFHLTDPEMARIRDLHQGYLPKCGAMCAKIAAKKGELDALLGNSTNITDEAQAKMNELAALRAQCQAQMLQHFLAVSQAMPPEEGKRYLDEMRQFTLGGPGQMEQSMSGDTDHEHHH